MAIHAWTGQVTTRLANSRSSTFARICREASLRSGRSAARSRQAGSAATAVGVRRIRPRVSLLLAVFMLGVPSAQAVPLPARRPLVAQASGILTIDPTTGKRMRYLTSRHDREPLWSPDGQKVAFAHGYENRLEIWVVGRDGSHARRITDNDKLDEWPSWAPGSRRLALERVDVEDPVSYDNEIFIVRADGSKERNLTKNDVDDVCPDWSPDGKRIAFYRSAVGDIYTIRPDGRRLRQLTWGPEGDVAPKWSPDGRRILFTRIIYSRDLLTGPSSDEELVAIDRDGSNLRQLTDDGFTKTSYAWSPNGKKIAFLLTSDNFRFSLWVINADGSQRRELVADVGGSYSVSPTWSRDSRRIIYSRRVENGDEVRVDLWSARADGSRNRALTTSFVNEHSPDWYSSPQQCRGPY